jgi:HEAT repeat protein
MAGNQVDARFQELFRELAVAGRALSSYPRGHPAVGTALAKAHDALSTLLAEEGPVAIGAARDALLWTDRRFTSTHAAQLARLLRRRRAARLLVEPGATMEELEVVLRALAVDPRRARDAGSLAAELTAAGLVHVGVSDLDLSALALVETDEEATAPETGAFASRVVRRLVAGGLLSADGLQRWTASGKTDDDLLQLLFDGGSAGRSANAFAAALRGAAQDFCESPEPGRAAALAGMHARLRADDAQRLVQELAMTVTRQALAQESLAMLSAALPAQAFTDLRLAIGRAAAEGREDASAADAAAPQIHPGQLATLRRAFAEGDVDTFRDSDTPVEELAALLELPEDRAVPSHSPAAERIATELSAPGGPAETTSALLELAERADLPAEALPRLLGRTEGGYRRLLSAGRIAEAIAVVERVWRRAGGGVPAADPYRGSLERMSDRASMDALAGSLPGLPDPARAEIATLVAKLEAGTIPHLLDVLAGTDERDVRLRLLDLLPTLGPAIARDAETRLSDARWYVVRNMLLLLRKVGDGRSIPAVRRCVDHPDLRVRLEAIHNLFAFDRRVPRELLRRALHDPDLRQAGAAMDLAGQYGYAEAVDPIVEYLRAWDPFGKRRDVRLKAIRALAAIRDPAALAGLGRFRARFQLLPPAREERRELYRTLPAYPEEWRRDWIVSGLRSPDAEIRRICAAMASPPEASP